MSGPCMPEQTRQPLLHRMGRVFYRAGRLTCSARLPSKSDEDAAPRRELWMGEAEARGDEGRQGGEETTRAMGRGGGDKGRRGEREGPTAMIGRERGDDVVARLVCYAITMLMPHYCIALAILRVPCC